MLSWLLLIGGGMAMAVLYERGERIGTLGYFILAIMLLPSLVTSAWGLVLCRRQEQYLDIDCITCGRPFSSQDLPKLRQTGCCLGCGQSIPDDLLEDVE